MILANDVHEVYRGFILTATPHATVWGYKIELNGEFVASRPNGALDSESALRLAKSCADELIELAS